MGINNSEYINGLNANDPTYQDRIIDAASHIRAIKKSLKQTFPNITGPVTEGPDGINGFEARIVALESQSLSSTPMASGSEQLSGTGVLTVSGLSFQPSLLMVWAIQEGGEGTQATISFGISDGTTTVCNAHNVIYNVGSDHSVGDVRWTDRIAQVDALTNSATIAFTSFTADGFTLTQSGITPESTITWTAWE